MPSHLPRALGVSQRSQNFVTVSGGIFAIR